MSIRTFAAAAIAAGVASAASADTVHLQYVGSGQGRTERVTLAGNTINVFCGQLKHSFSAGTGVAAGLTGTKVTFCTDLTEYVSSGGSTYTVAPVANLPQTSGWPVMGATRAQAVYDLFAGAAGQQLAGTADADYAAAFQIALWEIVYDYNGTVSSISLSGGNLKAGNTDGSSFSGTILSKLNTIFGYIGANAAQTGLLGLTNNGCQDQIVVVPLPPAGWAGLGGLALVAGFKRRLIRR